MPRPWCGSIESARTTVNGTIPASAATVPKNTPTTVTISPSAPTVPSTCPGGAPAPRHDPPLAPPRPTPRPRRGPRQPLLAELPAAVTGRRVQRVDQHDADE